MTTLDDLIHDRWFELPIQRMGDDNLAAVAAELEGIEPVVYCDKPKTLGLVARAVRQEQRRRRKETRV